MTETHTLRKEVAAAQILLRNFADVIGDDEAMRSDMIEGETDLFEALNAAAERIAEIDALCEGIDTAAKRLAERKERLKAQRDGLRVAIATAMEMAEIKKHEAPCGTISLRAVAPSLVVLDESQIPGDYWKRADPKLDKTALTKALKDKQEIPGCTLSNGSMTISIRSA